MMGKEKASNSEEQEIISPSEMEEKEAVDSSQAIKEGEKVLAEETPEEIESAVKVEEMDELKQKIAIKDQEIENYRDRFLRMAAEFENYKKRVNREREEFIKFAQEVLITELLPVLDSLERALDAAHNSTNSSNLKEGVEMTYRQLMNILGKYGLSRLEVKGKTFDPAYHEAVAYEENSEYPPLTIIEEVRSGYLLHSRVIRPAMVKVSRGKNLEQEGLEEPGAPLV